MARIVVRGPGVDQSIELFGDHVTIGRQDDNLVALADDMLVSRHHATLELEDGHWWIRDLSSSNGTKVDGRSVEGRQPLVEGSRVLVGRTEIVLKGESPNVHATLSDHALFGTSIRTVLFTDIERHTQLMQRLGDTGGRAVLREHEQSTRAIIAHHAGVEVKTLGDGFIASFTSAQLALACAVAIQRACAAHDVPEWGVLKVRIGINAGEPIAEDDDLFGAAVIAASRITDLADGGQVFVSNVVKELVAGKGFTFEDRGEITLDGFEDPTRCWELIWNAAGA